MVDESERRRRGRGRRAEDRPSRLDLRLAVTIATGIALGMLLLSLTQGVLRRLQGLLIALLVSLFLSFAMEPAVQWLSRRGMRRGFATWLVFLVAFAAIGGFFAAMAPLIADQVRTLVEAGPELIEGLAERARTLPGGVGDAIARQLEGLQLEEVGTGNELGQRIGGGILGVGETVLGGVFQLLTVLLITFYLVADGPRLRRTLSGWMNPRMQEDLLAVWELAIAKTGGYVYGRALVAVASAAFHAVAFTLIGLPYALALAAWVGVISSLIPVVGTYIAGALPIAVALASDSPIDAVWAGVALVVYQQIENYVVSPRITGHTMALHPAVAFLAVLIGGALLGAVGALLALPVAAIIGGLVAAAGERHEVVAHELLESAGYPRDVSTPSARS